MSNQASFYINDSPPVDAEGNRGFDATASQLLELRLAQPIGVLTVQYSIVKVSRYAWPLVFDETGEVEVLLGGGTSDPGDSVHIDVGPAVDISSYVVRATAVTPNAIHIFERLIAVRKGGMRLTVPAESAQYSPRGWSDALNDITKAVADGGVITPLVSGSNVGAVSTFPSELRRVFHSDGVTPGGSWDVLTQDDVDDAFTDGSIGGQKIANDSILGSKLVGGLNLANVLNGGNSAGNLPLINLGAGTGPSHAARLDSFGAMLFQSTNSDLEWFGGLRRLRTRTPASGAGGWSVANVDGIERGFLVYDSSLNLVRLVAISGIGGSNGRIEGDWEFQSAVTVPAPISNNSAMNKNAIQTGSFSNTGPWTFAGAVSVPTPTANGHASTKGYVDNRSVSGAGTPTVSSPTNCTVDSINRAWSRIQNTVHVNVWGVVTNEDNSSTKWFEITLPVPPAGGNFSVNLVIGSGTLTSAFTVPGTIIPVGVTAINGTPRVRLVYIDSANEFTRRFSVNFTYRVD